MSTSISSTDEIFVHFEEYAKALYDDMAILRQSAQSIDVSTNSELKQLVTQVTPAVDSEQLRGSHCVALLFGRLRPCCRALCRPSPRRRLLSPECAAHRRCNAASVRVRGDIRIFDSTSCPPFCFFSQRGFQQALEEIENELHDEIDRHADAKVPAF